MKVFVSFILILLFIPIVVAGILGATLRFQLTRPNFWLDTFEKNNVYTNLNGAIKDLVEERVFIGGGNVENSKVLTNLITPENLRDIFSKNLINTLDYLNGKARDWYVYVPIKMFPEGLLPNSVAAKSETITLKALAEEYNVIGVEESQIKSLGRIGFWLNWTILVTGILLATFLVLLYLLTDTGKRFWNMGVALLTSGILILGISGFLEVIRGSMITDWPGSSEPSQNILSTFLPLILRNVLIVWLGVGVFCVVVGIALFFLKKGVYNIKK